MYNEQAQDLMIHASNDEGCFDDSVDRQFLLESNIKRFEQVSKEMARLNLLKETLTSEIIGALGHEHEGQRTYEHGMWKIEIKTPVTYSINKKSYESGEIKIPDDFNPIKKAVSYTVDKRLCDEYLVKAPSSIKQALVKLIEKRPGKAGIVIKERLA